MKMHGKESRVNTSDLGAKTPGQQVILGWTHSPGLLMRRGRLPCLAAPLTFPPGSSSPFFLYSLPVSSVVCGHFSYSMWQGKRIFSLREIAFWFTYWKVGFSRVLTEFLLLKLYFFITVIDFITEGYLPGICINASSELNCKWGHLGDSLG